jgi:RNA polymerase sigma factor (sigma-70 family)
MKKEWVLTEGAFETLLAWLDTDRERAGSKYETIRLRLIKIFTCRGCFEAEELADETINRVVGKVDEIANNYRGDPALYFYGVSHNIHLEYLRKLKLRAPEIPPENTRETVARPSVHPVEDIEPEFECLERCLDELSPDNRRLMLDYYQHEKHAKIDYRQRLADELGIALNALRIRAHRMRRTLRECVQNCLDQQPAN